MHTLSTLRSGAQDTKLLVESFNCLNLCSQALASRDFGLVVLHRQCTVGQANTTCSESMGGVVSVILCRANPGVGGICDHLRVKLALSKLPGVVKNVIANPEC